MENKCIIPTEFSPLCSIRVSAHRLVLSASSVYFSAMFTGSLKESSEREVTLKEVSGDALQALVHYCYTGNIELREDTVEILLSTACLLQLSSVINACCTFLSRQLHPSNCLGFALFAEQQNCHSLMRVAMDFTCQNFGQVCRNQEFFQLNPDQLSKLLSSDDLNVLSEHEVFEALVTWVQHDTETRNEHVPDLLALIRLPLLMPAVKLGLYSMCSSPTYYYYCPFHSQRPLSLAIHR